MKYTVTYRDEFMAKDVEADSPKEAIEKFEKGDCKIEVLNELHPSFIQVFDEDEKEVF